MNLTELERIQLAHNKLSTFDGYDILPPDARKTLIQVFSAGMVEMEVLDTQERIMEHKIELNNILANG